ncbi:MAG: ThiF family adenylyltransferase [Gammaproteobacteria bacterium]|nr:ThiF family adenylyltransferase [Gammaproteobacteria bacterium]
MSQEFARYHRQMLLPGFGQEGQQRLSESTVFLLGCGALGSVAADMLARAGVGHLVIADRDFVDLTNLQRQVLFDERDVADATPKAQAAKRKIANINSGVQVTSIVDDINHGNIERYASGADVLLDGLDNFETRYLANDLAVKTTRAYIYGAAVGTTGMAFPILPHAAHKTAWHVADNDLATPCLRCLFEEAPAPGSSPTCDTIGVISSAVAIVANYQVAETLKILTGNYERVNRTLLNLDLWANEFMALKVDDVYDKTDCPCCKHRQFDYLDGKVGSAAAALCGRDAVQLRHRQQADGVDLDAIAARLSKNGAVNNSEFLLQAKIDDNGSNFEITLFADGRAIIKGTNDTGVARSIYAKYVGA